QGTPGESGAAGRVPARLIAQREVQCSCGRSGVRGVGRIPSPRRRWGGTIMRRSVLGVAVLLCFVLATAGRAGPPTPAAGGGAVGEKVDPVGLTIRPRGPDGRFGKNVRLKTTGTSKVTLLTEQKRAGKLTLVQREVDTKDLQKNQTVAVIYASGAEGPVLLAVVAPPAAEKRRVAPALPGRPTHS